MKPFATAAAVLLLIIALGQLSRIVAGAALVFGSMIVPMWLSGVAIVITAGLALGMFKEARRPA